jgi:hypothetical protein
VQEVPQGAAAQGFDQLARAVEGKTNHVDHGVRPELPDLLAECARRFGLGPIDRVLLDRRPRAMRLVRDAPAAADRDHLVAGGDHSRHEIRAHVSARADDHDSHLTP